MVKGGIEQGVRTWKFEAEHGSIEARMDVGCSGQNSRTWALRMRMENMG